MNQIYRKSPFWSLAGPLLAYLAIRWAVEAALMMLILIPYLPDVYAELMQMGAQSAVDMQEFMEVYMKAMEPAVETVVRYQVEISGAAAAGTLVLTGILFAKDRKLERACGIPLPEKKPVFLYVLTAVFGAVGSIAATCLMAMAQMAFYDNSYQQTAQIMYGAGFPVQLAVLGVLIPAAEEMMFRGILFKRFRERQRFWYSAVCSSVFFMFMHTNTTQMVYAFLLGLMLAYLYEKIGSVKAPVLLHIMMNAGSVIFTEAGVFGWLGADPARMVPAVIGGAFICSAVFVKIQRITDSGKPEPPQDAPGPLDMFR